jgi:methionine synthase II (cobalamin-independent)
VTGKISGKNHHFIKLWQQLQSLSAGHPTKLTIPSAAQLLAPILVCGSIGKPGAAYATADEFKADLTNAYKEFLQEYAAAGGKVIQFDDCHWAFFSPDNQTAFYAHPNFTQADLDAMAQRHIDFNNTLIDFGHELGLKVWTHNCRGNYQSRFAGRGTYDKIAHLFLKQQRYDRFFLEWDDDRAGSLDALVALADTKAEVVIGLLSSKKSALDDEERVVKFLNEAVKIIPKERLFLSHQCGFASADQGNELTEAEQWAKIDQGQKLALAFWGE